ncbi:MAG: primosomal protein N' [Alphaproteobacteria bacterium CG_4_10_14_0_8_um_filter_37_21]|nr:MAG: primosomal protein N' [Alphaproteobacteria bacterium CG_4_10_14_0_8_um_filter_37_21]
MPHYQVAIATPLFKKFTYAYDDDLMPGQVVVVPLRGKSVVGVVAAEKSNYKGLVKDIIKTLPYVLNAKQTDFCAWLSDYTLTPYGQCTRMMASLPLKEFERLTKDGAENKDIALTVAFKSAQKNIVLTGEQQHAVGCLQKNYHNFYPALLDGMTGSGKTEVYFKCIEDVLKLGGQALVLLPEITLSEQWIMRFKEHFGFEPLQWHSKTTPKSKRIAYQTVYEGKSCVVVGARSGLFLPFQKLNFIVVDEEHDASYKQEEKVIYNARDAAVYLGKVNKCPVVLASATPCLETYHNAVEGRYAHLKLKSRYGVETLPEVKIIDQRTQDPYAKKTYISDPLIEQTQKALNRNEQILFFVNKRGFSPLTLCKACGHRFECNSCSGWLTHHQKTKELKCHHCAHSEQYPPHCPACGTKDQLTGCGPGVERLLEESQKHFPKARHLVVSSDMMESNTARQEAIQSILNHQVDIIIGTQMMAKGHHFPLLTLIGIIDGDMGLSGMDLRACEKTFQMMFQVAGRAGREHLNGQVFLQTYNPDHPVIQAIKNYDRDAFLKAELQQRKEFSMPPFSRLISITLSSLSKDLLYRAGKKLASRVPKVEGVQVLGPTVPPHAMIRGQHRLRFLMMSALQVNRHEIVKFWILKSNLPSQVRKHIDVDPLSFM